MKLLLDTHVWIWSLLEPSRLSPKATRALTNANNELWLSSISLCEFFALVERGRLRLEEDPERWVESAFEHAPLQEAPLTNAIVRVGRQIQLQHRDPADRLIAATAKALDLTLLTADERLLQIENLRTISA